MNNLSHLQRRLCFRGNDAINLGERQALLLRDSPAKLVLGRNARWLTGEALHLDRRRSEAGLEFEDLTLRLIAPDIPDAHAKSTRLAQKDAHEVGFSRFLTEDGEHHGRPVLLHLNRS